MGCCQSAERVEEKQRNDEIEAQIKRDRANMKMEIKMLLLGKYDYTSHITSHHHLFTHR